MSNQKSINHSVLGELVRVADIDWWSGSIVLAENVKVRLGINSSPSADLNIQVIEKFVGWYPENQNELLKNIGYELFNHDLIHGENFIRNVRDLADGEYEKEHKILESKVDKSIAIKDINALDGELKVCVSVGEYTGGHPIEASLSEKYKVTSLDH